MVELGADVRCARNAVANERCTARFSSSTRRPAARTDGGGDPQLHADLFHSQRDDILALVLTGFQFSLGVVALGIIIMGFFIGAIVNFFNNSISNHLVGISGDIFEQTEVVDSIVSNDVHVMVA